MRDFDRAVLAALSVAAVIASPADAQSSSIRGRIATVSADSLTLDRDDGTRTTVRMSAETRVRSLSGVANRKRRTVQRSALIPGLPVQIDGVPLNGDFVASRINFQQSDVRTAQMINSGHTPVAEQAGANSAAIAANSAAIAANRDQIDRFGNHEIIDEATVLFATGSAEISDTGHAALLALAERARPLNGWGIEVTGSTDASGNAAANKALSDRRAEAVTRFLRTSGGLPANRIHAGAGLGIAPGAADNDAASRRVVARLDVDKGVTQPR